MGCNSCGGYNKYEGSHFGNVIWARYASTSELGDRYYDDCNKKQMEIFC
jgi:iron complex outermembrane receptor protein